MDVWQLLVACALMSRVSSHDVKQRVIAAFFAEFPTPSHVIDADVSKLKVRMGPTRLQGVEGGEAYGRLVRDYENTSAHASSPRAGSMP